jgi:hypothetical protein
MRGVKTQARKDMETILQRHTSLTKPLNAQQLSEMSKLNLRLVRYYLGRFIGMNLISNVGKRAGSAYYWNASTPREIAPSVSRISGETYCGPRWNIRAGASDHLSHPSRRGEDLVPYAPPMSIAGAVEPLGFHGVRT